MLINTDFHFSDLARPRSPVNIKHRFFTFISIIGYCDYNTEAAGYNPPQIGGNKQQERGMRCSGLTPPQAPSQPEHCPAAPVQRVGGGPRWVDSDPPHPHTHPHTRLCSNSALAVSPPQGLPGHYRA